MKRSMQGLLKQPGSYFTLTKPNILNIAKTPAYIQTNGSFNLNNKIARTAVVLIKSDGSKSSLFNTYLDLDCPSESEWRSIVDGIEYSIKKNIKSINLENNNLDVIYSLINRNKPSDQYIDYYNYIYYLVKKLDHLSIRWIPRGMNKADTLFRI